MKILLTSLSILLIATASYAQTYTVERVIDGDTIKHTNGERVRLIGIDTPESKPNDKAKRDSERTGQDVETIQKMGQEATEFVKKLLPEGAEVRLEFDVQERDKYGRVLAYVFIDTGIGINQPLGYKTPINHHYDYYSDTFKHFINATVIKAGYATPMTIPPNVKYADLFKELYEEAREQKRGLWGREKEISKEENYSNSKERGEKAQELRNSKNLEQLLTAIEDDDKFISSTALGRLVSWDEWKQLEDGQLIYPFIDMLKDEENNLVAKTILIRILTPHYAKEKFFPFNYDDFDDEKFREYQQEAEKIPVIYPSKVVQDEIKNGKVIEQLVALLDNENQITRRITIEILKKINDERIIEPILRMFEEDDVIIRLTAVKLFLVADERVIEALILALEDEDGGVSYAAWESLFSITGEKLPPGGVNAWKDWWNNFKKQRK